MQDPLLVRQLQVLLRRLLTKAGPGVQKPVTLAATTQTFVFSLAEPDASYGVLVTPSWLTTIAVTARTTGGFTAAFGTAAPAAATIDYLVTRSTE